MARLGYYLIVLPLSYLPFSILYLISDGLYLIMYYLLGYRKKVVSQNIDLVFSDNSQQEKQKMIKSFYRHFCDLLVEGIKAFTISNAEISKRYRITGQESTFKYLENGRNIIVAAGHSGNWEWASLACPLVFRHKCSVIITPLSNPFFNKKVAESRGRNGYDLVPKHDIKNYLNNEDKTPKAIFFLTDQSPSNSKNAYWTSFLGVESPVQYGVEKYAKELDTPIFYIEVKRENRGFYNVTVSPLIAEPENCAYGQIVEAVTDRISKTIFANPSHWLWSHRRWKHKKMGSN